MAAEIARYSKISILGKGSFGTVYLVRHNVEKTKWALKKIKLHNVPKAEKEATQMELKLLQTLRHPGIVGYKESFEVNKGTSRHALCIVLQLCDGGELAQYLERVSARLGG
jgi:NIMA (never in mitosis gene a)-related kinase